MPIKLDFVAEAKRLPYETKKRILLEMKETELHGLICSLINRLEGFKAEITHSRDEYGRDLVVKHDDQLGNQFIGVVVKKGNSKGELTAETDGVITDTITQSRQAVDHPCTLHELGAGTVKLEQVWIFFVGRLTHTASQRIEHELKSIPCRIVTLEPLIKLFSEHYPEVFFDPVLAEFIQDKLLAIEQIDPRTGKPHTTYISQWVSKWEKAGEITETLANVIYGQRIAFDHLTQIVARGGRILLTGEPGIGKTTAITKIASDMIKKNFAIKSRGDSSPIIEIPMLIRAKDLALKTEEELLTEFFVKPEIGRFVKIPTILVDGIDEVQADERDSCVKKAINIADSQKSGLVITCRKIPSMMATIRPFETYELLPLEYQQAISFIEKSIEDKRLVEILKDGILNDELKMQMTPLALELLIEVATYEKEIPASLAEVFERYSDLVCGKYDKSKGIEVIFEYQIKSRFLAELAWSEFFLKNRLEIPKASMYAFLKDYSLKHSWAESKISGFVNEISRSGLIRIGDSVVFSHRSFLEFFIALRIDLKKTEYKSIDEEITNLYFDDMWTEVTFYYIGIQREISPATIAQIADRAEDDLDSCVSKLMIGRLLQAGWHTPSADKIKGIEIGISSAYKARAYVDNMLAQSVVRLPRIFSDFFVLATCSYSFGSRTLLPETLTICKATEGDTSFETVRKCLILIWAQRSRLTEDDKRRLVPGMLECLAIVEKAGQLSPREKFVSLLMLEQIEKEDKKLLASIRRKMSRTKDLYKDEMKLLLPRAKKRTIRFSLAKKKGLRIDEMS